jgi:IS5 family transposase
MEKLLTETIAAAQRQQALTPSELRRVNVDTTVQEKAIAFPTDAAVSQSALCWCAKPSGWDLNCGRATGG